MGFVDPTGLDLLTTDQIELSIEIIGDDYQGTDIDFTQLDYFDRTPTVDELRSAANSVNVTILMPDTQIENAIAGRGMMTNE